MILLINVMEPNTSHVYDTFFYQFQTLQGLQPKLKKTKLVHMNYVVSFYTGTYISVNPSIIKWYSTAGNITENQKTADWSERKNNEYSLIL